MTEIYESRLRPVPLRARLVYGEVEMDSKGLFAHCEGSYVLVEHSDGVRETIYDESWNHMGYYQWVDAVTSMLRSRYGWKKA